jgi:hypothetical protein
MATKQKSSSSAKATIDKGAWANLGVHTITLPSGAVCRIRFPDLAMLAAHDAVPEHLRAAALARVMDEVTDTTELDEGETVARDDEKEFDKLKSTVDLHTWLLAQTIDEPELTYEDLKPGSPTRPPDEDLTFLLSILRRERSRDAAGVRLGVARIDEWEPFPRHHGCKEDCEKCQASLNDLSTIRTDLLRLRM